MRSGLNDRLLALGSTQTGVTLVVNGNAEFRRWSTILNNAEKLAASLLRRGIGCGARVCIYGPTTFKLIENLQALMLIGATFTIIPPKGRRSPTEFEAAVRQIIALIRPHALLVDERAPLLALQATPCPLLRFSLSHSSDKIRGFSLGTVDETSLAFVQLTSGSTGTPRAVPVLRRQLVEHVDAIAKKACYDDREVFVSWLPLFHDMGLVGFLLSPMLLGQDLWITDPSSFATNPGSWLEMLSASAGTVTGGPNSGYAIVTRAAGHFRGSLSTVRTAYNGSEPVDEDVVNHFCAAAEALGFKPSAMYPVFGMAEATLAVSFPPPSTVPRFDRVEESTLQPGRGVKPPGRHPRSVAILGTALPGIQFRIRDVQTDDELGDGVVGELQLSGSALMHGYLGVPKVEQPFTNDGWFRTGDLAYTGVAGLRVCGRIKDLIIVGGRNIDPGAIEQAAAQVTGVRRGNVVAFGVPIQGTERVVIVCERAIQGGKDEEIIKMIRSAVFAATDLVVSEVILVEPGSIPKTTSGKLQRTTCRVRYLDGAF